MPRPLFLWHTIGVVKGGPNEEETKERTAGTRRHRTSDLRHLSCYRIMTPFLNKAQREFLLAEYKEQLEEFDQLEEYGFLLEDMKTWDNVSFWQEVTEQMPVYAKPGELAKRMNK